MKNRTKDSKQRFDWSPRVALQAGETPSCASILYAELLLTTEMLIPLSNQCSSFNVSY